MNTGGEKHIAFPCTFREILELKKTSENLIPFENHLQSFGRVMYACVVHDYHTFRTWVLVHAVEKAADEAAVGDSVEGTFNNIDVDNSLVKADGREDGISCTCMSEKIKPEASKNTYLVPRSCGAVAHARVPEYDHPKFRVMLRTSTAASSTETSWHGSYFAISSWYSARRM